MTGREDDHRPADAAGTDAAPPELSTGAAPVVPASVWACGQRARATQRGDRYAAGSGEHPAPTLPDLAGYAISRYTEPGDWVLDPMCGIGTAVIEALTRGRRAVGIDTEPRWTEIARNSLTALRHRGIGGEAHVITGDARQVDTLLSDRLRGRVGLLFCAPPYGPIHTPAGPPSSEVMWRPGPALLDRHRLRATLTDILRGARAWLRPGAAVVLTIRPWRTPSGELLDLPADVLAAGQRAGLIPLERCAALLSRLEPDRRVHLRASTTHRGHIARLRAGGQPAVVLAHHDIYLFAVPHQSGHQPHPPAVTVAASAAERSAA